MGIFNGCLQSGPLQKALLIREQPRPPIRSLPAHAPDVQADGTGGSGVSRPAAFLRLREDGLSA